MSEPPLLYFAPQSPWDGGPPARPGHLGSSVQPADPPLRTTLKRVLSVEGVDSRECGHQGVLESRRVSVPPAESGCVFSHLCESVCTPPIVLVVVHVPLVVSVKFVFLYV